MEIGPLLLVVVMLVLFAGAAWVAMAAYFRRRRESREERVQQQIQSWERESPIEMLGGRLRLLPRGNGALSFVLLFWNNSGLYRRGITVRLVDVKGGLKLKSLDALPDARPMPLKLLLSGKLDEFRAGRRSRPLARLDLAAYDRAEVELAAIHQDEGLLVVEHETGTARFPLKWDDYELVVDLSVNRDTQRFSIGLKRLMEGEKRWVASLPKMRSMRR